MKRASLIAVLALLLGSCAHLYRAPVVELMDIRVVGVGLTSGTARVSLQVDNPNRFAIEVSELRYRLEIGEGGNLWTELANGSTPAPVTLARRSSQEVVLDVPFRYQGIGSALLALANTGEVPYRIEGDLKARGPTGQVDLPFRSLGSVGR